MPQITLENVDLFYPAKAPGRRTLKDFLVPGLFGPRARPREVKALDQISLQMGGGECVGVIGRNGAGKSTLLRAIAGVNPVSAGMRRLDGKICSLFDIAAGFEWNATGWENIRLRAYLQGESPTSLESKLERIADFTGMREMLHLPLNSYSTGRIMLLSFAIATCCEPDILLIDEFLSTADLHVRERVVGRLIVFLRESRLVVIASHDLAFLRPFCTRILWLDQGRLHADGPAESVIDTYLRSAIPARSASDEVRLLPVAGAPGW